MKQIFLDNNGTTPLDPLVIEAMLSELNRGPANPSSVHSFGRAARARLAQAREQIASYLRVSPSELIFTGSGTEALNLALFGLQPKGTIVSSKIEHAAVYETLLQMPNQKSYLPVDQTGHIDLNHLTAELSKGIGLISLSAANSETGVKNPLDEIARLAKQHKVPLVVDGVALLGKETFTIPEGVSAMAFSAHKIHGPKGIGLLYVNKNATIYPQLFGGGQERMKRPGTENLPGIIGFAKAIELLLPEHIAHMEKMRNLLEKGLEDVIINGTGPRVPNLTSITFPGVDGEALLIQLDQMGIAASMGSACSSGSLEPSRVLLEMGLSKSAALSTLRFSVSRFTTEEEIKQVLKAFSLSKSQ